MAPADTMLPSRHLEERSPNPRTRSPRRGVDSYRPAKQGRSSPGHARDAPAAPEKSEKTDEEKRAIAKAEYEKLLSMRSGGVYVPPHRLRALQSQIGDDKQSREYQRMHWDALKKSINGLINKVNVSNIKQIVPELFSENLIRGRGLFCQSLTKAQAASLPFTPIYAAVAAIVNTKLPNVGELLVKRLVMRFRKAYKRNDKSVCLSTCIFIAQLTNTRVVHEMLCAQILLLLLSKPTDDSVEIAVGLTKEVGQFLEEMNPQIARAIFDQYRVILNEAAIEPRSQYMVETLFQIRKDKFKDNPAIKEELDLVEEEDQITHMIQIEDEIDTMDGLNIFKFDEQFEVHEEEYKKLKAEILGDDDDDDEDEDEDDDSDEESEDDEEQKRIEIQDMSNTELVNLRKTIYLTMKSSATPEEATHKLVKLRVPPGKEPELVSMVITSCAEDRAWKFYGLIAQNLCRNRREYVGHFEDAFTNYYTTIHRYENNKLRNIAQLFGNLFATDSIGWYCLGIIHLNADETTAASRIFIKNLFEVIQENMGADALRARLSDKTVVGNLGGLFPYDNPQHIRFAINYFTSIKMGYLTEDMRTFLQNMPKPALPAAPAHDSDSDSVSSYSSYTGSSYSSRSRTRSRSRSAPPRRDEERGRSLSRTPPRRYRDRSYSSRSSRSRSPTGSVSTRRSMSRSPLPRRDEQRDRSLSRTPPRRYRDRSFSSRSRSRSPTGSVSTRRSISRSPPPRQNEPRGRSLSRTPPRRYRERSYSTRSPSRSRSRSRRPPGSVYKRGSSMSRSPSRSPVRKPRQRDMRSASPRRTRR